LHEGALAQLHIKTVLAEERQDTADVTKMLGLGLGVNENVVQVNDYPLVEDRIKDLEHHVGE
jgi:hypothetical protein